MRLVLKSIVPFVVALGSIFAIIWVLWLVLKTDYKYTKITVGSCHRQLTIVEYGGVGNRGVALVSGDYTLNSMPEHDFILIPDMKGFDAYFEFVPTCEDGFIVINSPGYLSPQIKSEQIISKTLNSEDYSILRNKGKAAIKLY